MRIAVIADIHGNLPALEAVLADIQQRNTDHTINLGDCVSGPLWPREVCDLLMASNGLIVRGNHDRWVSGPDPSRMGASDQYSHAQLDTDCRHWLSSLPPSADADHGLFACHGTATNDNQYLIEDVSEQRLVRAHPSTIRERLGDVQARVVLCGHSHQPHLIQLPNGPLILNPGSVVAAHPMTILVIILTPPKALCPHARYGVMTIIGDQDVGRDDRHLIRLENSLYLCRSQWPT